MKINSPFRPELAAACTNRALATNAMVLECRSALLAAGLPVHQHDAVKNWDNLGALHHACSSADRDTGWVLDAGAGDGSAFLPGLRALGFRNLVGNNLDIPYPRMREGVLYEHGDVTDCKYADGTFDFVACLSVVEHGVDVPKFLGETARILAPGGLLYLSTDYWEAKVDAGDRVAFGAPVRVFSADEIRGFVAEAEACGLSLEGEVDYACDRRVVSWIGLEYTFISLLLRKTPK